MGNGPCKTPGVVYNNDYIIEIPEEVQGLVNLGGIESPGLTSAPAIAEEAVDSRATPARTLWSKRIGTPSDLAGRFRNMSHKDRQPLVEMDPRFGQVICRRENITEGEITLKFTRQSPRKRMTPSNGAPGWAPAAQGGFDMTRVVTILSLPRTRHLSAGSDQARRPVPNTYSDRQNRWRAGDVSETNL